MTTLGWDDTELVVYINEEAGRIIVLRRGGAAAWSRHYLKKSSPYSYGRILAWCSMLTPENRGSGGPRWIGRKYHITHGEFMTLTEASSALDDIRF